GAPCYKCRIHPVDCEWPRTAGLDASAVAGRHAGPPAGADPHSIVGGVHSVRAAARTPAGEYERSERSMSARRKLLAARPLCLAVAGLGACGGSFPPPAPKDEAFCNIQAVPCITPKLKRCCVGMGACAFDVCDLSGGGADPVCITNDDCLIPIGCLGVICGGILQDPATVTNPALCPTTMASASSAGDRACFKSAMETPTAACAALCSPFNGHLDRNQWPIDGNLRSRCSSALNTDHSFHSDLNAQGFVPNGCMD